MTSRTENARKRKQTTTIPEVLVSSDESKNKARRVSTSAAAPTAAALQTTEAASVANTAPTESIDSIGKTIQDLLHSDNAKVHAALDALDLAFIKDKKKCDEIQAVGGCLALVLLLKKNCLDKAIATIPACDQVTELWELNELAELTTLHKALNVIIILTFQHDESRVGIAAIGGVEAVVKVMKAFPKCQRLQEVACTALHNLMYKSVTGKKKAIESGGIEVVLAAVNNHLVSPEVCENVCGGLINIVIGSKENTELLISLGGAAAVANVRREWPDNDKVQKYVRRLAKMFAAHFVSWEDELPL
jgi:hypothetical protein